MTWAAALYLVGSVVAVGGTLLSAAASKQESDFQADVANANADQARRQAAAEADRLARDRRRALSSTTAGFGAAGVKLSGSVPEVLGDIAFSDAADEALVRFGGDLRSRDFQTQASAAKLRGQAALVGGIAKAGSTALTSASTFQQNFGSA